jgi:RHS repeat-associated protein
MHTAPISKVGSVRERSIELLPGQYFDRETSLNYNYSRDYDSSVGRYVESDPVGLLAGINTYAYVGNSPLSLIDRFGLAPSPCDLMKKAPNGKDDPCGCQKDVLADLCSCYKEHPFAFLPGRGVCVEKAYLKKSRCLQDCVPKDACISGGLSPA